LKELVERLRDKPFRIVGINSDSDQERTTQWFPEQKISWRNVMDGGRSGPVSRAWHVEAWPTFYLLDASGKIRYAGDELRAVAPVEDKAGVVRIVNVLDEDIDILLAEMRK
jgi:hypothetical protein